MSNSPTSALLALLDHYQPQRLLCVSVDPIPAAQAYAAAHPDTEVVHCREVPVPEVWQQQRYDLALVAEQLEILDKQRATELLAGLRNLLVNRLAVLVDLNLASDWQEKDFFALAMQRQGHFQQEERSLHLFSYDLQDYKQVPDWLNAKYWANPELFGKYWW
ncbi:DUF6231 family protein [Halopseudomonas salegens]|uniref:Uncharacterized protein n=1 Tax=Halopseudomonas salegens TaxID=1434072 RepID=A0A1H2ELK4_9GAMM|nr:DUF6231 family protein [Halopseudomonas salegens]SDT95899.1 hypothetical protein SAMN05216210_0833 [Halopseudomonas salegens]